MKKYICPVCGYIYVPEEGDVSGGVPENTRFADLPDDWSCPTCGTEKQKFELYEE